MAENGKIDHICDILRARICSGQLAGGELLIEKNLAQEFSLSRTPIRQVLHRLALQHFVETKSGVGTMIVPDDRFNFVQDLRACRDLVRAATRGAAQTIEPSAQFELSGLSSIVERLATDPNPTELWDFSYRMNRLVGMHLNHDLLSETFFLLSCRIYRRFISLNRDKLGEAAGLLVAEYSEAKNATGGRDLIEAKLSAISNIKKAHSTARRNTQGLKLSNSDSGIR